MLKDKVKTWRFWAHTLTNTFSNSNMNFAILELPNYREVRLGRRRKRKEERRIRRKLKRKMPL